jgi:hypothetical protein
MFLLATDAYNVGNLNGKNIVFALTGVIFVASCLTIVIRTAWTTATDTINENLMFYTSMKPSTIVFGKIISGVIFTLLLMSITSPFLTLAYAMRGIDVKSILVVLILIFIAIQVLNSFAIFIASSNKIEISPYASTIIILAACIGIFFLLMICTHELLYKSDNKSVYFWHIFRILFFLGSILISVFICGSIAMFSPSSSNRVFPFRVTLTSILVLAILLSFSGISYWPVPENLLVVEILSLFALPFLILLIACERDQWSARVRRNIPQSLVWRSLIFPFYSGAACGIAWIFLIMASLFLIDRTALFPSSSGLNPFNFRMGINFIIGLIIFTFNYGMTAMLIRSWFFKKKETIYVLLIVIILLLTFTIGSILIYFLIAFIGELSNSMPNLFYGYSRSFLSALNPFYDLNNTTFYQDTRVYGMLLWFVILCIPLAKWYSQRLGDFNPNVKEEITYEEAREIIKNIDNK